MKLNVIKPNSTLWNYREVGRNPLQKYRAKQNLHAYRLCDTIFAQKIFWLTCCPISRKGDWFHEKKSRKQGEEKEKIEKDWLLGLIYSYISHEQKTRVNDGLLAFCTVCSFIAFQGNSNNFIPLYTSVYLCIPLY